MFRLKHFQVPFPPRTQGDLVRWARGDSTQADFASTVGVHKSSLSRYEAGKLGAPTHLINYCLERLADALGEQPRTGKGLEGALENAKRTVELLEGIAGH